jgi:methyltransferase (TIGR00027 family)
MFLNPSRTAFLMACARAAHQSIEDGVVLRDPLAVPIVGPEGEEAIRHAEQQPNMRRALRLFAAARARFAEETLLADLAKGTSQLVILGAGLDTLPYRFPRARELRIFEIDSPDTQNWKRYRLAQARIAVPATLSFVTADLEADALTALAAAGFEPRKRTFFTGLGVVPYLSERAIFSLLEFVARLENGATIVFDYSNPPESLDGAVRIAVKAFAARVAELGEPFRSHFHTGELVEKLEALGFEVEDLGAEQIREHFFPQFDVRPEGAHIMRATTVRHGSG